MVKLEFILIISATNLKLFPVKEKQIQGELLNGIKNHLRKCQHYRDNHLTSSGIEEMTILLRKYNKLIILRGLPVTNNFFF